jgi:cell division septation protein DedD
MVHVLKNIAIRLWIAIAVGGLAALGLLAVLGSPLEAALNLTVAVLLTILAFIGCGWVFNRITALRLHDYLREAAAKERTARIGEAAEAFRRAVVLFDSFMASPLFRRRMGRDLAGRVARFHIARSVKYPEAEEFITSYLWAHPDDVEIAEYWFQHTRSGEDSDPDHLALADRIAAAQPRNLAIQGLISQVYLSRNRTDYTALQIYKHLLRESGPVQAHIVAGLADLFIKEGRADEWALEVYFKAHEQHPGQTDYLRGLANCLEQIRETTRNESLMTAARDALSPVDEETIRQWRTAFRRTAAPSQPQKPSPAARTLKVSSKLILRGFQSIAHITGSIASVLAQWGKSWRESDRTRHIARWTAVIAFAAIVIISGISTIIYISETKESPESASSPAQKPPETAASGRFTIQVAAYRNRDLAIDESNRLKQQGFPDAYWGESRISDENIWYYVRISRFEGKQEAKEFGDNLKSKGIINDFYVANYKEP